MYRMLSKLGGAIIFSLALINPAIAAVYRVELSGTFTQAEETPPIIPLGTPFVGAFLVDTNAAPVETQTVGGLMVTGYAAAAISGLSITAGGVTFTDADIQNTVIVAGQKGEAVYFSVPLANNATPSIFLRLEKQIYDLEVGAIFGASLDQFANTLTFEKHDPLQPPNFDTGTLSVRVSLVFAGMPGRSDCHGKSVSALAKQYGGLSDAATMLGFTSVSALQDAIKTFCGA